MPRLQRRLPSTSPRSANHRMKNVSSHGKPFLPITAKVSGRWIFLLSLLFVSKFFYVLLIVSHDRRKIEHVAVTANPTSAWVVHQIREATPFGSNPDYLLHDNDSIFTSKDFQEFLANSKIKSLRASFRSPWQNGICERTIGILRRELLDHIIPLNEKHLEYLLREYIGKYYNPARPHQGINCQTPILSVKQPETSIADTVLVSEPILSGLYYNYRKAA